MLPNQILVLGGDEGLYLLQALGGVLEMPSSLWDCVCQRQTMGLSVSALCCRMERACVCWV